MKVKSILAVNFLLVCLSFILISCEKKHTVNPGLQITDDLGITVSFESHPVKIVSLAPNITEALFAIGADSLIAGVTDFCDFPEAVKTKPKTGSYLSPDYEKITSINPDLILINVESTSQPTYQALRNLNLKLFVSNAKNFSGIIKMLRDFGLITNRTNFSDKICDSLDELKNYYGNISVGLKKAKSLIIISVNPLMTANGSTFINETAELSGLDNLYKNEKIEYPMVSFEDVIMKDPDVIILPTDTTDEKKYNNFLNELKTGLNTLNAVKENRIILIDDNVMFRPGPRIFNAVKIISDKLIRYNVSR